MARLKWFVVSLITVAMLAVGVGAFVSAQTGEVAAVADCVNCDREDIPVQVLPDGTPHPSTVSRREEVRVWRETHMEEVRQKAKARFNSWEGTKAFVPDAVPGEDRDLHNAVAQIFDGDLPAPAERLRQFSQFIGGQPTFKCVGWSVKVVSVTPVENGWQATVHVRPEITAEKGGVWFTPQNTVEKWHIAADGTATVLDVKAGDGHPIILGG